MTIHDSGDDAARQRLVASVEARIGPIPAAYRDALLAVDRARFVRREDRARAWNDEPLALDTPHGSNVATVSAPHMYVLGFQALRLASGDRLLELGSGSGYGAALAAHVVGAHGAVTTVEVDPHLARIALGTTAFLPNVRVLHADGLARPDLVLAHDKTWLTFSVETPPRALIAALPARGVLVAPVGSSGDQRLLRYERRDAATSTGFEEMGSEGIEGIDVEDLGAVRFVHARPLIT